MSLGFVNPLAVIQAAATVAQTVAPFIRQRGSIAPSTVNNVMSTVNTTPVNCVADWDDYLRRYPDVYNEYLKGSKFTALANASGLHPGEFHYKAGGFREGRTYNCVTPATQPSAPLPTVVSTATIGGQPVAPANVIAQNKPTITQTPTPDYTSLMYGVGIGALLIIALRGKR